MTKKKLIGKSVSGLLRPLFNNFSFVFIAITVDKHDQKPGKPLDCSGLALTDQTVSQFNRNQVKL